MGFFMFMPGMPFGPKLPMSGPARFGRISGIIARVITTSAACVCLGIAAWTPYNWHANFPEDGWCNIGWLFTLMFICYAALLLIYGWVMVELKPKTIAIKPRPTEEKTK